MIAIAKPAAAAAFRLRRWSFPRLFGAEHRRRKQTTIDLIHASPHLLRDIGMTEENARDRRSR